MLKGKMRSFICLICIMALISGCTPSSLRDKFIRKKKDEGEPVLKYQPVHSYDVKPSMELYTKRYIFWKNWHRELLSVLRDPNQKKVKVAIEQEIGNLYDMKRMLVDEKAEGLQRYIDEMVSIEKQINKEKITLGNVTRIRRRIENAGRGIKQNYSYRKMRGCIRDDFASE